MLEISIVKSKTGILLREITVLLLSVLATKCSLRYFLREDIKLDGRTYLSALKKKKLWRRTVICAEDYDACIIWRLKLRRIQQIYF